MLSARARQTHEGLAMNRACGSPVTISPAQRSKRPRARVFCFVLLMAVGEQSKWRISTGQVRTRDGDCQGHWIKHWQTACSKDSS